MIFSDIFIVSKIIYRIGKKFWTIFSVIGNRYRSLLRGMIGP